MVNAIRFLERARSLWDGVRNNFMNRNGLTGEKSQSGEIDYTN